MLNYVIKSDLFNITQKRNATDKLSSIVAEEARNKQIEQARIAAEKKRIADEEREAKRVAAEQAIEEGKKNEEAARVARIPQPLQNEFTGDGRLSFDGSKRKCIDLGFKPSTEGFWKCVLQLSK